MPALAPNVRRRRRRRASRAKVFLAVLLCVFAVSAAIKLYRVFDSPSAPPHTGLQIAYNRTPMSRSARDIKYIVIHDTDNTDVGADASKHYSFFNSGDQKSSADFFVDDHDTLQVNDYYRYYTWHCGDGGEGAKINNQNSIGVEICVNSDGDYTAAVNRAKRLVRSLMEELSIDKDHVVRHRDASGKNCPRSMSDADWQHFLDALPG